MSQSRHDTSVVRYAAVSLVMAKVAGGIPLREAIDSVVKSRILGIDGRLKRISPRTLYRWVRAFQAQGLRGLKPKSRVMNAASRALSSDFIQYLATEKKKDPDASLPEIIRRAGLDGVITQPVSRVSAWRAARRLNLPIFADKGPAVKDMRRFAYPNRMQMMLTDGKHFRAGVTRKRRVVMAFLDDATRFGFCAVVGSSEHTTLFLRGLWLCICRWGLFSALYVDNGSAFCADETTVICARLNIFLIKGTAGYPEGHGKIERFNQTIKQDLLRTFDGSPEIDTAETALELRVDHYLKNIYNRRRHESLNMDTPEERFLKDPIPLRVAHDLDALRAHFTLRVSRRISRDNIASIDSVLYEMPKGHAGQRVDCFRHLLDGTVSVIVDNRHVNLSPVDTTLNALSHRARRSTEEDPNPMPARSAATRAFLRDHQPIVGKSGDYQDRE